MLAPTVTLKPSPSQPVYVSVPDRFGKKVKVVVTILSQPLPPTRESTPIGLDSSYVLVPTVTLKPSPSHPVYVSVPVKFGKKVKVVVTILSQPFPATRVSTPIGLDSS